MKYCAKNDLSMFEFHDAGFSFVSFDGKDLVVSASMVNIHKDAPQNPYDCDMELASAQITFQNVHSATYEPGRAWVIGEDGESHPVGPRVVFSGQDAIDRIMEELQHEIIVYHLEKKEDHGYSLEGCGIESYFEMEFDFDGVVVSWDEYEKKAWYELHRQYRYDSVLDTPQGEVTVQLHIVYHEESMYYQDTLEEPPIVDVGCKYDGQYYWGHGHDELWIDAFADLQRQLPADVFLKCCLTCRHGNMCPVGNGTNEVFCTKDVLITQKSDLYFYTEDNDERAKRSRQYCGLCEDYQPQTDDFYTYTDYLHFLKKE